MLSEPGSEADGTYENRFFPFSFGLIFIELIFFTRIPLVHRSPVSPSVSQYGADADCFCADLSDLIFFGQNAMGRPRVQVTGRLFFML